MKANCYAFSLGFSKSKLWLTSKSFPVDCASHVIDFFCFNFQPVQGIFRFQGLIGAPFLQFLVRTRKPLTQDIISHCWRDVLYDHGDVFFAELSSRTHFKISRHLEKQIFFLWGSPLEGLSERWLETEQGFEFAFGSFEHKSTGTLKEDRRIIVESRCEKAYGYLQERYSIKDSSRKAGISISQFRSWLKKHKKRRYFGVPIKFLNN